jgi:hypothetical protein
VRGHYRIVDAPCLSVLAAVVETLGHEQAPFAVAGGMGVQALLASKRLEHLLRRTGDVDLLIACDDATVVRLFNEIAAAHPGLGVVQNPAAKNVRVGAMNVDWINDASRLRGMEDAWLGSIEHACIVTVRGLEVPVQEPEVLLAAKLTGQKVRSQDEFDIAGLVWSRIAIDEARLRQLVRARPERFDVYLAIKASIAQDEGG